MCVPGVSLQVCPYMKTISLGFMFIRRAMQDSSGKTTVYNEDNFDEMEGIDNGGNERKDSVKMAARPANEDIYSNQTGMWIECE